MALLNIFEASTTKSVLDRLEQLKIDSQAEWGKMNAAQMLAHLNVPYEMVYKPENFKRPGWFGRKMATFFAKKMVVGDDTRYPKNGRTAPDFIISDERDFKVEMKKLVEHIKTTESKGVSFFDGKESMSLGALSAKEWSNMFYKHIDHHLNQFGI